LFWFSLQLFFWKNSILRKLSETCSKMYTGLHVKCPLFFSDFNEKLNLLESFQKFSNIKFHENPSSESRVVPCRQTDGRTGMMMLIVASRNFAKDLKNISFNTVSSVSPPAVRPTRDHNSSNNNITCILCVLDRASSWYLNKGRPTWWHLVYYVNLLLNMFRMY